MLASTSLETKWVVAPLRNQSVVATVRLVWNLELAQCPPLDFIMLYGLELRCDSTNISESDIWLGQGFLPGSKFSSNSPGFGGSRGGLGEIKT